MTQELKVIVEVPAAYLEKYWGNDVAAYVQAALERELAKSNSKVHQVVVVTPPDRLTLLQTAVRDFEEAQKRHVHAGALDTEPDRIFHWLLKNAFWGNKVKIPTNAHEWELYKGNEDAAEELTRLATRCVDIIKDSPEGKPLPAILEFLTGYCWRTR